MSRIVIGTPHRTAWPAPWAGVAMVLLVLGSMLVSSPAASGNSNRLQLPPAGRCRTVTPTPGAASSVPLAVTKASSGAAIALVSACINGTGPFPLVLDTGASVSIVDTQVVRALHLASAGAATKVVGVNCAGTARPVRIKEWSIGSVRLTGQTVESTAIPNFGLHRAPAGLLGSDILSRFGAVRIDYQGQKLLLPGPEGAETGKPGLVKGPTTIPTPPDLLVGYPSPVTVPIDIASGLTGGVLALAPVQFGTSAQRLTFAVDTGSADSSVATSAASLLNLPVTHSSAPVSGATCTSVEKLVTSGPWSLNGTPLQPQDLVRTDTPTKASTLVSGTLGSNQLSQFGSVVLDYAGARLLI